jgi:DNA-binding MarR family transcriptional regulator
MHVVMFGINRAFHKVMELGKALTFAFELTPSRFNLMNALLVQGGSLRQVYLRRMLGVTAPNVSRMVSSLEKLGFVERKRDAFGRCCAVELTPLGRKRIESAVEFLVLKGNARAAIRKLFLQSPDGRTRAQKKKQTRKDVKHFAWHLSTSRTALKDKALLRYSWLKQKEQPHPVDYWGDLEWRYRTEHEWAKARPA